ncbi:hypothetical protein FNH22_02155 [Fulvivirga sp. M361]|uniref:hypothetical protein n=1 Tax=Fulvivirga sp. M361 TaxID=2594266 RepID=UPI00117B427F|nr:hypothetical protein [Fulvivirga sp. M361]TRX62144.1 hypothetical protein FNH22_02155 [Fulvivirga sp. M361]
MKFSSPEIFHQRISLFFHLMIALPLIIFVYLFLEMKHNDLSPVITTSVLEHAVNVGFTLISGFITVFAYVTYSRTLLSTRMLEGLSNKLERYFGLFLKLYTMVGFASALVVLGLFLTTSPIFIVDYVLLLFILSLHRPTPKKYVNDLRLEGKERKIILSKGEFTSN